jgi:redox-sensitive bicupin YhaK (pirin superfamily)
VIEIRRDEEIYRKDGGWFRSRWHFSFDEYYDPENMGFGTLRVFNDDVLIPGAVWPMHPHRDVEALTYVPEGTFEHRDSMDNGGLLPAGSVQRMTLGSGAYHSEMNGSQTEPVRFIQMWVMPRERGLEPSLEQKVFTEGDRTNVFLPVISPDGDGGLSVHQDAWIYISRLEMGKSLAHEFLAEFGGYFYVIGGDVTVSGESLATGDAARIRDEGAITIEARQTSELIMAQVRV